MTSSDLPWTHVHGVSNDSPRGNPPRTPSAAVRVSGGELQIIGGYDGQGRDISGGVSQKFAQTYGRWEARLHVDSGAGAPAAILLWPKLGRRPADGEIDIMEASRDNRQSAVNYVYNGSRGHKMCHGITADFTKPHTVTVDWLPDHITFWLDGVPL